LKTVEKKGKRQRWLYINDLIFNVHLIKFINATNTIISKHQCTCLQEINNGSIKRHQNQEEKVFGVYMLKWNLAL
jgi:hypothetical protein